MKNPKPRSSLLWNMGETAKLAWPVILGYLGHMIIGQADILMVGQYGKYPLAASTVANSLFYLPFVIGIGICMAISPLVAQSLGANQKEDTKLYLSQGGIVAFWSGILFVGVTLLQAELIPYLGQDEIIVPMAQEYMRIIGFSSLPMLLFLALKHYTDGFEDVVPGMLVMGGIVLANIFMNWLLIYGNWGFPELGLNGAGYATIVSRTLGFFMMWAYLAFSKKYQPFRSGKIVLRHHWKTIVKILQIGIPSGIQYFFEVGSFTGAVILIGWIGPDELAAHQIALGIPAISYMVYMGLAGASSIRVGNAFGRKDLPALRMAGMAGIWSGAIFIVFSVTTILLMYEIIPGFYIDNPRVEAIAARLLVIAAFFQVADGVQAIALGALRGMEDVLIPTILIFIAYWGIGLPVGYLLLETWGYGADGMWYGLSLGLLFSALFLTIRFERRTRLKRKSGKFVFPKTDIDGSGLSKDISASGN